MKSPLLLFSIITLLLIVSATYFVPKLMLPVTVDLAMSNSPPSMAHPFGTDALGRDLLVRISEGVGISLTVGFIAALVDLLIGVSFGGIATYFKSRTMLRVLDIFSSLPKLLVAMVLTLILGTGIKAIIVSIALVGWVPLARVVTAEMIQIAELDFVAAAQLSGASSFFLIRHHYIPSTIGSILVMTTKTIPKAIYFEAFLSVLGLGVQAPYASLGTLVFEGVSSLRYSSWRLLFPCLVLIVLLFCLSAIAEKWIELREEKEQ